MQLIREKKLLSDYFLSILYFAIGIQNLALWLYSRDSQFFQRYFCYSDSAFVFLIGPSLYLLIYYMTGHTSITPREIWLRAAPFFASLVLIEVFNLLSPAPLDKHDHPFFISLIALSYLSLFLYSIRIYKTLLSHYRKKQAPEIKTLIFCAQNCIVFSFTLILSVIWKDLHFISVFASIGISLFFIFFFIRYPGYFNHVQNELRDLKYANSQLRGVDKDRLADRLENLMAGERISRRSTLTLKELSYELGVSTLQLSELLNSHYDSNFNNFVNSYRVEEVKAILEADPEANILQTAIDCGFNSKTTFNRVFRNHTGLTPSQFREKKACQFIN